jgi:hypothetical protein
MPGLMPDVSSFLTRGRQRTLDMQAAGDAAYDIEDNATSGQRPDLLAQMQAKLALEGMRNARARESQGLRRGDVEIEQMDPEFQRENARLDSISGAETFMDPRMTRMRGTQTDEAAARRRAFAVADAEAYRDPVSMDARRLGMTEDVDKRRGLEELAIVLGMDPRRLQQIQQEHQRKLELSAAGSQQGGAVAAASLFRKPGAHPSMQQPSARGAGQIPRETVTVDEIRAYVRTIGGGEAEVLKMIDEASAKGLLAQ